MEMRFAKALAAGTVMALPLLSACGGSTAPAGSSASSAAAPASSAAAAPSSDAASPSPSATSDPAQERAAVEAASEKFVEAGLTIGYPDKHFSDYAGKLKPLTTAKGLKAVTSATTEKKADDTLGQLYAQRVRITPKIKSHKVVSLAADTAEVTVRYQSQYQNKNSGGWKTAKTDSADTVDISLVRQDGAWLVDDLKLGAEPQAAGRSSRAEARLSPVKVPVQPNPLNVSVDVAGSSAVTVKPLPTAVRR